MMDRMLAANVVQSTFLSSHIFGPLTLIAELPAYARTKNLHALSRQKGKPSIQDTNEINRKTIAFLGIGRIND